MKTITHRNSTRRAFLSGACLALLAVPCVSLGEVKITASRDYVDKKVAAAVTNLTAYKDIADAKQDPATTLSGYGITDATLANGSGDDAGKATVTLGANTATMYTATKTDALIEGAIDALNADNFKTKQTAVTDPTADGNSITFIATASQNANGEITVTKATVPTATTSVAGITSLSSAVDSTDENVAATPKAVKAAYDLADGKQSPATTLSGYGITDAYTKTQTDENIATAKKEVTDAVAEGYKPLQTAKSSPTAETTTATAFIDTVSQDANGVITATKKTLPTASTSTAGIVQLSSATTSTDATKAATSSAVKAVKDIADAKVPLSNIKVTPAAGGTSSAITSSTVVELGNAFIVCTTTGEGTIVKRKAVLYAR